MAIWAYLLNLRAGTRRCGGKYLSMNMLVGSERSPILLSLRITGVKLLPNRIAGPIKLNLDQLFLVRFEEMSHLRSIHLLVIAVSCHLLTC